MCIPFSIILNSLVRDLLPAYKKLTYPSFRNREEIENFNWPLRVSRWPTLQKFPSLHNDTQKKLSDIFECLRRGGV